MSTGKLFLFIIIVCVLTFLVFGFATSFTFNKWEWLWDSGDKKKKKKKGSDDDDDDDDDNVNCFQSAWVNDGACTGGKQQQKRSTVTPASGNGTACGNLTQEIGCTDFETTGEGESNIQQFYLKSKRNEKYCSVQDSSNESKLNEIKCDTAIPDDWEKYEYNKDTKYLKSLKNNKYCSVDDEDDPIICDRLTPSVWERYEYNKDTKTLKSLKHNKYCTVPDNLLITCNSDNTDTWEKYDFENI